ncbi:outer membrane protein assembly factor BamB [Pseudohaliea rubra]|uniref:Outer membrane protein assembly factor BamB n=1 Tax=Pseudohaliea rubra DSM 19751 TaxID=1265313 RepID=A0A095VU54_9GAMM|nr:outer membrane protein assembly factor BamB [Pseudohaliea rubra]KGE04987.1 Outer membrane protein YfgL, lipoprotein component of the protein assembly complex [Pseudohaliea rubra DSM 19751]
MSASLRAAWLAALLPLVAGCSTIGGWFDRGDDEDPRKPAELVGIDTRVNIDRRWSVSIGDGQGKGLYKLQPVIAGTMIYAASVDGQVRAIERDGGRTRWREKVETGLSGGVGYYDGNLYLGSTDGEVLRLDAEDGSVRWSARVSGEVLAPPQGDGQIVVAQTYDGKLHGLDHDTGERLWSYDSNVPVLTMRGTSTPILREGTVYAGFANGRVLAFDAPSGAVSWEARVAIAQGRSEIERIVDIDGTMTIQGSELYAASYQGRLTALDLRSGRKLWQRNVSSFSGVSQGFGNVYVADDDGTITAYLRDGQGMRWEQPALAFRELSRPTPVSSYLAVTDYQGYLHILSQVDGEFVGRTRVDGDGARADMLADGNLLYVFGNSGKLVAYEITPRD